MRAQESRSDAVQNSELKTFAYNGIPLSQVRTIYKLPYLAKQYRGYTSMVVIANSSAITATVQIDFRKANGDSALSVLKVVTPHGTAFLDLDQERELSVGRYQAVLEASTGVALVVYYESAYMAMGYSGQGITGTNFRVPKLGLLLNDPFVYGTTLYLYNTELLASHLTLRYYNFYIDPVLPIWTDSNVAVRPFESREYTPTAIVRAFDNVRFLGSMQVTGDRTTTALTAITDYRAELSYITSGEVLASRQVLPLFKGLPTNSQDIRVSISVVGDQNTNSSIHLRGRDKNNNPFDITTNLSQQAHSTVIVGNFVPAPETYTSLYIDSSQPVYMEYSPNPLTPGDNFGYGGQYADTTELLLPIVAKNSALGDWNTKIGLYNQEATTNSVTLYFRDPSAEVQEVVNLPGYGVQQIDLAMLTRIPNGFRGQVLLRGTGKIAAVVIGEKAKSTTNHVRVLEKGLPQENAIVAQNGVKAGISDSEGLVTLGDLAVDDALTVAKPVYTKPTIRAAHDGWAYRVYHTNVTVHNDGMVVPDYTVKSPGLQILTTTMTNTLLLFNIVVSVEWDADDGYLAMLKDAFQKASDYLYDVSDGQMVFGQVAIYDAAQYWTAADFQISTKNTVRPYAYVGGITAADSAHAIRVGRFWDGGSGNQGNWNEPVGYRTLVHEFGHYALYLEDEYFVRTTDAQGRFTGRTAAACTAQEIYSDMEAPINASIMYYQYKASELADSDRWTINCQNTEQHRVNGKSDWETVLDHYGGSVWTLKHPAIRGSVMAGPEPFPRQLLPFPEIMVHNGGLIQETTTGRAVTVVNPAGQPVSNALVALFTTPPSSTQTIAIDQGLTDGTGHIVVYGAVKSDRLQAATFDGALAGAALVGEATTLELRLARVGSVTAAADSAIPHLSLIPSSEGTGLVIQVNDLPQSPLPLNATLIPAEGGGTPKFTPLAYSPTEGGYSGAVTLEGIGLGTGRLQVSGGALPVILSSDYNLQPVIYDQANSLYAEDGNFAFHLPPEALSGGADGYATVLPIGYIPGPLPPGKRAIGAAYEVRFSSANTLTKDALVELSYHPEIMGDYAEVAIYFWNANEHLWQFIGDTFEPTNHTVSAHTAQAGIYAMFGEARQPYFYLPLVAR